MVSPLQILRRPGFGLVRHRGSVLGLERPANERSEAAGARLHFLHSLQVLQSLGKRFAQSVHHRHRGFHTLVVSELHDLQPAISACFLGSDNVADPLHQDLATAARNGVEPRRAELTNDIDRIHPEQLREEIDLARAEPVNVNRVTAFDVLHQVQIPLERYVGVVPTLNQNLDSAERLQLLDLGTDLLERKSVSLSVLGSASERAEAAIRDADISVVDVAVDNVGDDVAGMLFLAHAICLSAQLEKRSVGVEVEKFLGLGHAAGRKVRVPLGILPRSTSRR